MIVTNVHDLIGNTPIISFTNNEFEEIPAGSTVYAKLEFLNPGGSVKDRLGQHLITSGIEKSLINSDTTIIEPTAGNTGIGVALAALKYKLKTIFVVPEKFSQEKQDLMTALGAQIVHSPTEEGIKGAIAKAKELDNQIENSYLPLQFENDDNPDTYYKVMGPEITKDLNDEIDSFVAGVGSGGTFSGLGKYLQEKIPDIRLIGVEPEGSILNGGQSHGHEIEGIGVEFIPKFFQSLDIAGYETVSDQEGFDMTRKLASTHGLLVGSSSGAAMVAALREASKLPQGSKILTIFPDGGEKYLSKDIYKREEY